MSLSMFVISLFFVLFTSHFSPSSSQKQSLFSPIQKDSSTKLYTLLIYLKTPLQPSKLHLDLGSYVPFYDCSRHYKSSSYKPVYSNSTLCQDIKPGIYTNCFRQPGPGCVNESCGFFPESPVTHKIAIGQILLDKFALPALKKPGQPGPTSDLVFSCTDPLSDSKIYRGLAKGSTGLAALGRFNYSLPAQISRAFFTRQIFALCLPSSPRSPGVALFTSGGPYKFSNSNQSFTSFLYTPLIVAPQGADTQIYYWFQSPDYYIGLTSVKVNDKLVPLNRTLLAIDDVGRGGTKISTSTPYTVLHTQIYKSVVNAFVRESALLNLTVVKNPVKPFAVCYNAEKVLITRFGPLVPNIDLVLESDEIFWRIYGSNSMVRVKGDDVELLCLGFIDGGVNPRTSIVIGGHQFEDNLLEFDLESGRLRFSSSLLYHGTSCADYNLSSTTK